MLDTPDNQSEFGTGRNAVQVEERLGALDRVGKAPVLDARRDERVPTRRILGNAGETLLDEFPDVEVETPCEVERLPARLALLQLVADQLGPAGITENAVA